MIGSKQVRTTLATKEKVPPYVVFADSTLVEMATYLPQDKTELRKISGVGDLKLEKFAGNFLPVINDYSSINKLSSRIGLKGRVRKTRAKRDSDGKDTFQISLEMFRSGRTISQIAAARELTTSTVEGHLSRFIQSGEIDLTDIVIESKIEPIRNAILKLDARALGPIKEYLGEDYSYGEIRAVLATM